MVYGIKPVGNAYNPYPAYSPKSATKEVGAAFPKPSASTRPPAAPAPQLNQGLLTGGLTPPRSAPFTGFSAPGYSTPNSTAGIAGSAGTTAPPSSSGGGGGGGAATNPYATGGGGGPLVANNVGNYAPVGAAVGNPTEADLLPTDSIYAAEVGGINADIGALIAGLDRNKRAYDTEFGGAMRNLGWQFENPKDWQGNPDQGSWRTQDKTGAFGSAYGQQQNDYAARGMFDSSFYGRAKEDLISNFARQRGSMTSQRSNALNDWELQKTAAESQERASKDKAYAAAMQRRASAYGLSGV